MDCEQMVEELEAPPDGRRPIDDARVLDAMEAVPRDRFVPETLRALAFTDQPLPIGHDQTISQPYMVARISELALIDRGTRVLEVGSGCGYQAAVLAQLGGDVVGIERIPALAARSRATLAACGYDQVRIVEGDGRLGSLEHAPYDVIVVSAAPVRVPPALIEQLAVGGRLIVPEGLPNEAQILSVYHRDADGQVRQRAVMPVAFVPLA